MGSGSPLAATTSLARTPSTDKPGFVDIAGDGEIYRLALSRRWIEEGKITHEAFYRTPKDDHGLSIQCSDRCLLHKLEATARKCGLTGKIHGVGYSDPSRLNGMVSRATDERIVVRCTNEENDSGSDFSHHSHAEIHGLEITQKTDGVFYPTGGAQNDARRMARQFTLKETWSPPTP